MEPLVSPNVKRDKMYALKTCLRADEEIQPGRFLFYEFGEPVDIRVDTDKGYRSKIESKFSIYGAGKTFLLSLGLKSATHVPYDEAVSSPKWDFRFVNYCNDCKRTRKPNIELREETLVNFEKGPQLIRAFYTTELIPPGGEILWDYKYHKKRLNPNNNLKSCTCGKIETECPELNRPSHYDYALEDIINNIGKNEEGNRRYYVKWKGLDPVNNTWVEETEIYGLAIFHKYEKKRRNREKMARKDVWQTIKSGGDEFVHNADSSSGEEDERVNLSLAAPMKVIHVCKEILNNKPEIVCYVKFSNWEVHRLKKSRVQRKLPLLLIKYYENQTVWSGEKQNAEISDTEEEPKISNKRFREADEMEIEEIRPASKRPNLNGEL